MKCKNCGKELTGTKEFCDDNKGKCYREYKKKELKKGNFEEFLGNKIDEEDEQINIQLTLNQLKEENNKLKQSNDAFDERLLAMTKGNAKMSSKIRLDKGHVEVVCNYKELFNELPTKQKDSLLQIAIDTLDEREKEYPKTQEWLLWNIKLPKVLIDNKLFLKDVAEVEEVIIKTTENLTPTLEEIKKEFETQMNINEEIKNSLNCLNKYFKSSNDIQPFHNKQSELDKERNDLLHLIEDTELQCPDDLILITNRLRKVLIERRVVKESLNSYKALSKIEGLSKIDFLELNAKNYTPRILDLGKFKSGDTVDISRINTTISTEDYKEFVEELHKTPVTNKFSAKQIGFVKNSLKDLQQKVEQMRNCNAKYDKFRVVGSMLHCYN